jgi:periplasmic protein CpxP/Spy
VVKIFFITLAVIGLISAVGIAWARHNGYCAGGDYLKHVTERVSRKLDLNEEQNQRLQGIAEMLRKLRADWAERRTQSSNEIESLLAAPTLDRDRVMDLLTQRHEAMAERKREIVDTVADFSDNLQPEQRARLAELIADRMHHRWGPPRWAH